MQKELVKGSGLTTTIQTAKILEVPLFLITLNEQDMEKRLYKERTQKQKRLDGKLLLSNGNLKRKLRMKRIKKSQLYSETLRQNLSP